MENGGPGSAPEDPEVLKRQERILRVTSKSWMLSALKDCGERESPRWPLIWKSAVKKVFHPADSTLASSMYAFP